ncbi:uncharacterized protein C8A04DRAFT_31799 [Dichotomopilus funicola]|uniref:Uncharacterized protein n=1 Tax=Dichotomopilus funicola TaxID=1934379 RepID=A0AAN6ZKA8_9PEZI|nr:hypothetical protein C8A04DRAFT_31799 [Dichotomopilus funicola]
MVNLEWNHFDPIPPLDGRAKGAAEKFYRDLQHAYPEFVADFENKFTAWQARWFDPESPGAVSALQRCELPEYDPLLFLGPKITPLVVHELSKPGNFIATTLYNHLETDPQTQVHPDDILNYLTLTRHANLIVELNYERFQRAQAHLNAWKARCHANRQQQQQQQSPTQPQNQTPQSQTLAPPPIPLSSPSAQSTTVAHSGILSGLGLNSLELDPDTSCAEYEALVRMGPGIVAQVMLEYNRDRTGPWGKLVHQLICERPLEEGQEKEQEGFLDSVKGQEGRSVGEDPVRREKRLLRRYEKWRDWFECQEHHEVVGGSTPSYLKNVASWS